MPTNEMHLHIQAVGVYLRQSAGIAENCGLGVPVAPGACSRSVCADWYRDGGVAIAA